MPELPEVEVVRRALEKVLLKQPIVDAKRLSPALRYKIPHSIEKDLKDHSVERIERKGKWLRWVMDHGACYLVHLGMSGHFRVEQIRAPLQKHDHWCVRTATQQLVYHDPRRFGFIVQDQPPFSSKWYKMGLDAMDDALTATHLKHLWQNVSTAIKPTLLNQKYLAGVGNIYASEALFMAGIHPQRAANRLTMNELEKLLSCVRVVLNKAIVVGGSTLRDHQLLDGAYGAFQHQFSVYERDGKGCNECHNTVQRIVQAGRSTFYCPNCQRQGRRAKTIVT